MELITIFLDKINNNQIQEYKNSIEEIIRLSLYIKLKHHFIQTSWFMNKIS